MRLIGGALAWPLAAHAQAPTKLYRIFWVSTGTQPDPFLEGFREGLRARGYVEGKNLVFELHYAPGNHEALRQVVSELRRSNVDLAVSSGPATRAITAVTDVPVLFAQSGDPVALGLVKSLARPGGNFTGATFLSLELAGKRVELLKDIFPKLRTLAVLSNTDHPGEPSEWRTTQEAAKGLGIVPLYLPFVGVGGLDSALAAAGDARADAILVFPDPATMMQGTKIAQFAIKHRLPSMFGWSEYCDAGGLMSYAPDLREAFRQAGIYTGRILKGTKPGDLPVVQPTRFEFVINLKTAKTLGLEIPPKLLALADEVIE